VIPRVQDRGTRIGGLLRYLYGPGKRSEHVNPRVIAAWDGAGDLAALQPTIGTNGKRDFRDLIELLEQPLRAARRLPKETVWHASVRNHVTDRVLTDEQWAHIAGEMMAGVGLAPHGDTGAVRWVAIRHDDYGIHLAATLVRQDGRTAWLRRDKIKSRQVAHELEERYGLRRVGRSDKTSPRQPSPAETNKARRLGRALTTREELRRRVRAAVAGSMSEDEFAGRLRDSGVLVEFRSSTINPGEKTGYKVALAGDTATDGVPVWFSGGRLAADLTLPKLRQRWARPDGAAGATDPATVRVSAGERARVLAEAARTVAAASDEIRRAMLADPDAVHAVAQAASDTLYAIASTVEGRRSGRLMQAAELFDKAARVGYGKVAKATSRSYDMRAMSRLVNLMGRISGDEDLFALLALVLDMSRLGDTLAQLRDVQGRWHQAEAARQSAELLRAWHTDGIHPGAVPAPAPPPARGGDAPVQPAGTTTEQLPGRRRRR
jgi:hypothetical protein